MQEKIYNFHLTVQTASSTPLDHLSLSYTHTVYCIYGKNRLSPHLIPLGTASHVPSLCLSVLTKLKAKLPPPLQLCFKDFDAWDLFLFSALVWCCWFYSQQLSPQALYFYWLPCASCWKMGSISRNSLPQALFQFFIAQYKKRKIWLYGLFKSFSGICWFSIFVQLCRRLSFHPVEFKCLCEAG